MSQFKESVLRKLAGTRKDVVGRLNQELVRSLAVPAVKEQATKLGMEIVGNTAEEYGAFLRAENAKWGKMVKDLGLRADGLLRQEG